MLLTDSFIMLSAKALGTSTLNVNNNSFPGSVITDRDFRETGPKKQNLRPNLFLVWAALNFPSYVWPEKMLNQPCFSYTVCLMVND